MAWLFLVISSLSWVGFDFCRKKIVSHYHPLQVSFYFSLISLPFYLVYVFWADAIALSSLNTKYFFTVTISGVLAAIGAVSFIAGLAKGRFSVLIPVLSLTPIVAALVNRVIFATSLSLLAYLLMVICCFSTYRLLGKGFKVTEPGAWYLILAAVCWGACICFDQFALTVVEPSLHMVLVNLVMLLFLGFSFFFKRPEKNLHYDKNRIAIWSVGAFCFMTAVLFQFISLTILDASVVEVIKRAIGIVAALFIGRIVFKELLVKAQYLYIFLTSLSAIFLSLEISNII